MKKALLTVVSLLSASCTTVTYDRILQQELREVKEDIAVAYHTLLRLEATAELNLVKDDVLSACRRYIEYNYRVGNPELHRDYEAGITLSSDYGMYQLGCKIYLPEARSENSRWKFLSIDELWKEKQ
jgi:hypothetical protein